MSASMYDEEEISESRSVRSRSRSSSASRESSRNRSRSTSSRSSRRQSRSQSRDGDPNTSPPRKHPEEQEHAKVCGKTFKGKFLKDVQMANTLKMRIKDPQWNGIGYKLVAKVGSRYFSILRGFEVEYILEKPMQEPATKCHKSGYFFCLRPEQAAKQPVVVYDARVRQAPHVLLRCQCDGPFEVHKRGRFTCSRLIPLEEIPIPSAQRHRSSPTVGIKKLRSLIHEASTRSPSRTHSPRRLLEGYTAPREYPDIRRSDSQAASRPSSAMRSDDQAKNQETLERNWLNLEHGTRTVIGFKLVARYKDKYFSLMDGCSTEFKLKEATEGGGIIICRTPLKASTSYFPRIPIGFGRQQWRREYVITYEEGLPVTATRDRNSAVIGILFGGSLVTILEFAHEKLGGGRMRARIESPAGWITTKVADGSCHFAKLVEFERAVLKCACFGPFVRHSDDKVACEGIVPLEEVEIEQHRAEVLREYVEDMHAPVYNPEARNVELLLSHLMSTRKQPGNLKDLHTDVRRCFGSKVALKHGTAKQREIMVERIPSPEHDTQTSLVKCEAQYNIDDLVRCRDFEDQDWKEGLVTSASPLRVRPHGWTAAKQWNTVRPIEALLDDPLHKVTIGGNKAIVTADAGIVMETVLSAKPFLNWVETVSKERRVEVTKVHFQSVDMFGKNVGFIKFVADARVDGEKVPGIVFMRGGSVAILVVLYHEGREYTLVVRQPRVAVGSSSFAEIPAGMLDGSGSFVGVAAKEMKEETGLLITENDLIDMTQEVHQDKYPGIFPTCGASDEFYRVFLYRKEVSAEDLANLNGKLTGVIEEGEMIKLQIISLDALWRESADAKALVALCLYRKLCELGHIREVK